MPAKVEWRPRAVEDLMAIVGHIAQSNPTAAQELKDEIHDRAGQLADTAKLYKVGRVRGTREMVVRPNYIVVYREQKGLVVIVRVLHAAQQWP